MRANHDAESSQPAVRLRPRRLRLIGALILLVGLAAAGTIYWRGTRTPDFSNDPSMIGFDKAARRQIAILYGGFGELTYDLTEYLKRPRVQAGIILLVSAAAAVGCFCFAHMLEYEDQINDPGP